ncbi:MAG: DUF924 domain-containing protein [Betaproteobacteria bacterium]|nr:DUF924 domain-containing protein [Betaproteobacteria bacterium]
MTTPDDVLAFWFGPGSPPTDPRPEWFRKSPEFDEEIRTRFAALHEAAVSGSLDDWANSPRSLVALIIVLDQFSRNLYRETPRAFAADAAALSHAHRMIASGWDDALSPLERAFVYLPFEHAESLPEQDRSVALFGKLARYPETQGMQDWALKHREVIARFGRFPHRNAALGRATTAEEAVFLEEPGSRF